MPRIRSLKPESLQHRKVGRLSDRAFRLWIGMLTQADDEGRLVADPDQLRVLVFGYHPRVSSGNVQSALEEIQGVGLCRLYLADGVQYADFPSWHDHQRISHKTDSKLPPYHDSGELRKLPEGSGLARARGSDLIGVEGKGVEALTAPAIERSGSGSNGQNPIAFEIPESIQAALGRAPILGAVPRLRQPAWWQAQVRANGRRGIDFAAELLKAEAWLTTNPRRAPKHDHARFLHTWFGRAEA